MAENFKSVVDRNVIRQINVAETGIKHFLRSHDKNAENAIFRTIDESTSILGEIYNAVNN